MALEKRDFSNSPWRQKFRRAEYFSQQLVDLLEASARQFPPAVNLEAWDGEILRYRLLVTERNNAESSIILGDCLHNYHSCLDSLYFGVINHLAKREGKNIPDWLNEKLSFPIWTDKSKFLETQGLVEFGNEVLINDLVRHQPFNIDLEEEKAAERFAENHPLNQLRVLSNKDKHRYLNIVYTYLDDFALFHSEGIEVEEAKNMSNLDTPMEYLFEFKVKNGNSEQEIHFIPKFLTGVSHKEGQAPSNSIQNMLGLISNYVMDYMNLIEYHFDNVLNLSEAPTVKT
jgi:hypothetical protein